MPSILNQVQLQILISHNILTANLKRIVNDERENKNHKSRVIKREKKLISFRAAAAAAVKKHGTKNKKD
jgi:hypothetical protein